MVVLGLYEGLLVLLYFGSIMIVLSADPNIKAIGANSVFAAHRRGGLSCVPLQY